MVQLTKRSLAWLGKTMPTASIINMPITKPYKCVKMEDKNTTLKMWHVFAWRPFAQPGEYMTDWRSKHATYKCVVSLHGGVIGRHAKTCQIVILADFRLATNSRWKCNAWKVAHFCVAGQKVAMRKHESHHLAGFLVAPFRVFAPKTRLYDMAQISHHNLKRQCTCNTTS